MTQAVSLKRCKLLLSVKAIAVSFRLCPPKMLFKVWRLWRYCMVGFSMGGLIARYYLQELEGARYFHQFFSISTPHHGSLLAFLSNNKGVKQMRPGSEFLCNLEQSTNRLSRLTCYSYWTPYDLMILPASSSVWKKAENIKVNVLCHPLMVRNQFVIADIIEKAEKNLSGAFKHQTQ
jgi:triacylglycerol lipase